MKKTKDGRIIASLTEVKNRTGDIFALVDEYGEITLTSHSRPKYKIIKMSLNEYINLEYEDARDLDLFITKNNDSVGSVQDVQSETQNSQNVELDHQAIDMRNSLKINSPFLKTQLKVDRNNLETHSIMQNIKIDTSIWNRNNQSERKFIQLAIRPL